jgi:hypothetical protein
MYEGVTGDRMGATRAHAQRALRQIIAEDYRTGPRRSGLATQLVADLSQKSR